MNIKYPLTLKYHLQTREITDYADLLDLFDSECPEAPLNEQEEPPADEILGVLRSVGWRIAD